MYINKMYINKMENLNPSNISFELTFRVELSYGIRLLYVLSYGIRITCRAELSYSIRMIDV